MAPHLGTCMPRPLPGGFSLWSMHKFRHGARVTSRKMLMCTRGNALRVVLAVSPRCMHGPGVCCCCPDVSASPSHFHAKILELCFETVQFAHGLGPTCKACCVHACCVHPLSVDQSSPSLETSHRRMRHYSTPLYTRISLQASHSLRSVYTLADATADKYNICAVDMVESATTCLSTWQLPDIWNATW